MRLFKYIPKQYVDVVLKDGAFLFRSLSYFQDLEDEQIRGDRYEGAQKFAGDGGLEITNKTRGTTHTENWIFNSKVDAENIFIFSTSKILSKELAYEFKAECCIEILDSTKIISGLSRTILRRRHIKPNRLFHGDIQYYKESQAPGIDWAFPNRIVTRKLEAFLPQQEYRFYFSIKNALGFGRTQQQIEMTPSQKVKRNTPHPEKCLKIGNIEKWCKVHEFT